MRMLTPALSRAARALLDWSQEQLAEAAHLGLSTVRDFERGRRVPSFNNLAGIERALREAGIDFTPENGGGAGVRFRLRKDGTREDH